jgi:C-terminal peptidase prc
MLAGIDPFTTYIDPDSKQRFDADTRGSFFGVGLQIRNDEDTDLIRVITPIRNSPGQNAGIRAGDLIERITRHVDSNGKALDKPEVIEARGLDVNDAVRVILGKVGTKVTLTIRRGMEKPFDVELTRAVVRTESVLGHRRKDDASWDYMIDADKKIGYIRVSSFQEDALRAFAAPVADLKKAGMTGLVLDLRFNPGGYLMAAYGICDLLIEDGVVVTVKPRSGKEAAYKGRKPGSETDFPVVCLVNSYSASGSEIVAACLQDHNRAIICGERTYGKGSVQHTEPFEGGLLKFTMARYYRPSGKNVDKLSTKGGDDEDWGVRPDSQFEVKLSRKENDDIAEAMRDVEIIGGDPKKQKKATDRQLEKALEYLRAKK